MPKLPQSPKEESRKVNFEFMGYSDADALEVFEGFMGALMKKDVRHHYDKCYEGVP